MRFRFIEEHRQSYPVRLMCRVLEVSSSGYYAWRSHSGSRRSREDRRLKVLIRAFHRQSGQSYGAPRIHLDLIEHGERCGRHRVARLMREAGLQGARRRRYRVTTDSRHTMPVAPNHLAQHFTVRRPNQVWLADLTYLPTREGWLYLAAIMDLASRRIVGWSTSEHIDQPLVLEALDRALAARRPEPGLLHHSDRGAQYAGNSYQGRLAAAGLVCSMSRKGNCWDNAPMESWFATLKIEYLKGRTLASRALARRELFDYIERFYNRQRRHTKLGYISPAQWEAQVAA
jgi:transposase InsO family protein